MHIGKMIKIKLEESNLSNKELMMALHCSRDKLTRIYNSPHVNTELLLKCCLLLKYDFFEECSSYYKQIENDKKESS
jgi:transposase